MCFILKLQANTAAAMSSVPLALAAGPGGRGCPPTSSLSGLLLILIGPDPFYDSEVRAG